jgi:hypothetical protein
VKRGYGSWGGLTLVLLLMSASASSHTKSSSYSSWRITGNDVAVTYTIPLFESARLREGTEEQPSNQLIAQYLSTHLGVLEAQKACPIVSGPAPLSATSQFRRFELRFHCPSSNALVLHSAAFFDLVPSHVSLAQIQTADGRVIQQIFTRDDETLELTTHGSALRDAGFFRYVGMGIMHIFTGIDHMSFLLGLVLISRRPRDLVFVVTGFTLGHSATLSLAVTGVIRPHAEYIDALVALTIAMIGAENIAVATRRPVQAGIGVGGVLLLMALGSALHFGGLPPLILLGAGLFAANYLIFSGYVQDAARIRIVVTLVFGFIHGFGFAADLLELHLPQGKLFSILLGFNLGVEVGQLSLVVSALVLVSLLVRMRASLPRPLVVDVLSAGLVGLGTYWFVSRSYA